MTTATQQRHSTRWVLPFLAALVAALAAILFGNLSPASAAATAETRVGASSVAVEPLVGPPEPIAAGQRLGNEGPRVVDAVATGVAANAGDDLTRVGRWMSQSEYDQMVKSSRVIEGGGGRTYVVRPPNPETYKPGKGVYAEFDVPTSSLHPAGGNPNYAVIPGPNAGTTRFGPLPTQMPRATCIELVCRR